MPRVACLDSSIYELWILFLNEYIAVVPLVATDAWKERQRPDSCGQAYLKGLGGRSVSRILSCAKRHQ